MIAVNNKNISINDKNILQKGIMCGSISLEDDSNLESEIDRNTNYTFGGISMKWNQDKSIVLSKISVIVFFVMYVAVLILSFNFLAMKGGASIWLSFGLPIKYTAKYIAFLCKVVFVCAIPLGMMLVILYRLLQSVGEEQIFTAENIRRLRQLSWLCILLAIICACISLKELFFLLIAACALLMGLLLRVIKNVFQRAREIKEENDYTI